MNTNKKYFKITYEVFGGKRIDYVMFFCETMGDAIGEFIKHDFGLSSGFTLRYTVYAIIDITN